MGTPEFSLPSLDSLYQAGWEIGAVVTQPDRLGGRGRKLIVSPVKCRARELGLDIWQPEKLSDPDFSRRLEALTPDLIAAAAFGQFIPPSVLGKVRRGGINLHPSLLPRYRGAAPIAWPLIKGDKNTGVTVHYLTRKMDAGDILAQETVAIDPEDDRLTLSRKLARLGAKLLLRVVGEINEGRAHPRPQNESMATPAPKLSKEDGRLDWKLPASDIYNLIRGLNPWPGAYSYLAGEKGRRMFKIIKGRVRQDYGGKAGEILETGGGRLIIAAGSGAIEVITLQIEGGRRMSVEEFLRGHRLELGEIINGSQ